MTTQGNRSSRHGHANVPRDTDVPEGKAPYYYAQQRAGAVFGRRMGWEQPFHYGDPVAEHHIVRNACGLIDSNSQTEIYIEGKDALEAVQRLWTANPDERHRLRLELEANGAVANFPVRLTSKSGKVIDCQLTATLQLEDDGESWGIQGIVRDVTEMKRTQEALRQSEMAARRLAEENEVVAEVGRINSSSLNIEEIYQQFGDEVKKLIPYDRLARIHRRTPMDGVRKAEGG